MKTKIISIILTVAIAVTGFTVRSSAAFDPTIVTDLLKAIGLVTAGAVAGGAAMGLGDCLAEVVEDGVDTWYNDTLPNKVVTNANNVFNNEGIGVTYNAAMKCYEVTVNSSLTGDDLEYATILSDKLNNYPNLNSMVISIANPVGGLQSNTFERVYYEELKTIIGQATTEFTYKKGQEYAIANGITLENNGAIPVYDFNFVGPIPSIGMPEHYTSAKTYNIDGYTLTRPYTFDSDGLFSSTAAAELAGCTYISKLNDGRVYGGFDFSGVTALCRYAIYNGVIYFCSGYLGDTIDAKGYRAHDVETGDMRHWLDINGNSLEAAGAPSFNGLQMGFCYSSALGLESHCPTIKTISDDDFITTTGGTTIEVPRTGDEQAIADGIKLGIVDEDGDIILDDDGNIVSIDGMPITKLIELIQQIAIDGSVSFDSIEEYLSEISRLLRLANVDSATMNTVISNLKELEQAQSKDIADINANVAAIAEALTASKEITADKTFEIETPSTIIDKFPFSLPFDLHKAFNILSAEPKAPSFEIPLKMEGVFDYSIDIDLSEYEFIAEICRGLLYAIFIVGLILATNKLIGRG